MKRTKLVALTLVVAMMMMGAGYAYWSQDMEIENTVSTGDLDVIYVEPSNVSDENSNYQPNADATPNGHGMTVTYNEVYPGLENKFEFTLENIGSIGAYVDDFAALNPTGSVDILDQILCKSLKIENHPNFVGGPTSTLADALNYVNGLKNGKGIFVDEDETVLVTLKVKFAETADEITLPELETFGFDIESNVYQYNAR